MRTALIGLLLCAGCSSYTTQPTVVMMNAGDSIYVAPVEIRNYQCAAPAIKRCSLIGGGSRLADRLCTCFPPEAF